MECTLKNNSIQYSTDRLEFRNIAASPPKKVEVFLQQEYFNIKSYLILSSYVTFRFLLVCMYVVAVIIVSSYNILALTTGLSPVSLFCRLSLFSFVILLLFVDRDNSLTNREHLLHLGHKPDGHLIVVRKGEKFQKLHGGGTSNGMNVRCGLSGVYSFWI